MGLLYCLGLSIHRNYFTMVDDSFERFFYRNRSRINLSPKDAFWGLAPSNPMKYLQPKIGVFLFGSILISLMEDL